ncbi:MAG TPA: molybdenum cofactor guanylyltransferase [Actinomycetota bacterium]|nr:molybdenum cofactor guanylyltransferase [Actinomycetota bacterium]
MAGITGIVLAGGRSTRFGRDKLAEPYRGRPLLEHVVLALGAVCGEVVIVLAPGAELTPMPIVARVTHDEVEGQGPLVGAAAGLREARGELAVLGGGDMPGLVPAVLRLMLAVAERNERVRAVVLRDADRFRPLPSVVRVAPARAAVAEELGEGGRRLRDAIARLEPVIIDETEWTAEDPGRRTLFDVDEPADLGD